MSPPPTPDLRSEVIVVGGGIAGIVAAYELLEEGKRVLLIDKDLPERFGGLAKKSFGGVHMIDTPHQRKLGIRDDPQKALADWESFADFGEDDHLPKAWAKHYCENSRPLIFDFLSSKKIKFLPIVNWPERGVHRPGNSVPRWHIAWGTGFEIIERLVQTLEAHPKREHLEILFEHEVNALDLQGGRVVGVHGRRLDSGANFEARAEHVVIASGGICGGDLKKVRANWYRPWGEPPQLMLNGAHRYGDGLVHDAVREHGGKLTHLDKQWHYAAGLPHPKPDKPHDGLSLVPPRSALWFNALGERIMNPGPLVPYTDTRHMVCSILKQPGQYSWQVLNWKIAIKELAVSGCDYMTAFRYKKRLQIVKELIFGNKALIERLMHECPEHIVVASSIEELAAKMTEKNHFGLEVDTARLKQDVSSYDAQIEMGPSYFNDEQLRWLMNFRSYRGDRIRTCKFQRIDDPRARPLIAIKEFILSRKSLGGIQTDLQCRVQNDAASHIPGLYAIGEAAGFGGGGIHGKGSLEGTFLGGCVLTGRMVAHAIARA